MFYTEKMKLDVNEKLKLLAPPKKATYYYTVLDPYTRQGRGYIK